MDTNAAYNDIETISFNVQAQWDIETRESDWDKSSLDFDPKGLALKRGASFDGLNTYFWVEIFNSGETITFSEWQWELYKASGSGEGEKQYNDPILLGQGVIDKDTISQDHIYRIEVEIPGALEPGVYRFKVRRPLDHPAGNGKSPGIDQVGYTYIWSEDILLEEGSRDTSTPLPNNVNLGVQEEEPVISDTIDSDETREEDIMLENSELLETESENNESESELESEFESKEGSNHSKLERIESSNLNQIEGGEHVDFETNMEMDQ